MSVEDTTTVAEIQALLKVPGALKIITSEVRPDAGEDPDMSKPSTFVLHNAVALQGPDSRGRYLVSSEEGDWTTGYPNALLSRLREWRNG